MSQVYDCAALSKMLSGHTYISEAKIEQYETHKADLRELKRLAKNTARMMNTKTFLSAKREHILLTRLISSAPKKERAKRLPVRIFIRE